MRLHRFIGEYDLSKNEIEIINPKNIKQIKGVLRLGKNDHLILCDGRGKEAEVEIQEIIKGHILTKVIDRKETKSTQKKVSLYLAILKKENFELAVEKAVECGVSEIIPVITERTIKTGLNMERLQKTILEASEQSGRMYLPTLHEILLFDIALQDGLKNEEKIIFDLSAEELFKKKEKSISIFIGPEGGFGGNEIKKGKELGYKIASLGPLTLRAETATIISTYLASN